MCLAALIGWGQDVVRRKERNARFAENGDRVVEVDATY